MLIKDLRKSMSEQGSGSPPLSQSAALSLATLYCRVGRYQDAITLFERFPGWCAVDLREFGSEGMNGYTALSVAAKSLAKVGRSEEALRIVRYGLIDNPDETKLYEVLVDIPSQSARKLIDDVISTYPADPRPLIWKAELLRRQAKLHEAEGTIRVAIQMDPLDASWDHQERRFWAYTVLASTKRDEGRPEEANRLTEYPTCSRFVDQARELEQFNMTQAAIDVRRKELALLPTDFLSRLQLGNDLLTLGREAEATKEITGAWSTLPSHVIEPRNAYYNSLFPGNDAKPSIGVKLLESSAKRGTLSADGYAILGRLQGLSGDPAATASFSAAVHRDPNCAAGWIGLAGDLTALSNEELQTLRTNLRRLGLGAAALNAVNYADVYGLNRTPSRIEAEAAPSLFDLPASRRRLEETPSPDYVTTLEREQPDFETLPSQWDAYGIGLFTDEERLIAVIGSTANAEVRLAK